MTTTLTLFSLLGFLGAWDTIWYHEFQQNLSARQGAATELRLHAARDFAYAILFGSLGWFTWNGLWVGVLGAILLFEILITLWDFIEEDMHRPLPPGERVMHTLLAINYGAFLAHLLPQLMTWSRQETGFTLVNYGVLSWLTTALALGVCMSGVHDLVASFAPKPCSAATVES